MKKEKTVLFGLILLVLAGSTGCGPDEKSLALIEEIKKQNLVEGKMLIAKGADILVQDKEGWNILHHAADIAVKKHSKMKSIFKSVLDKADPVQLYNAVENEISAAYSEIEYREYQLNKARNRKDIGVGEMIQGMAKAHIVYQNTIDRYGYSSGLSRISGGAEGIKNAFINHTESKNMKEILLAKFTQDRDLKDAVDKYIVAKEIVVFVVAKGIYFDKKNKDKKNKDGKTPIDFVPDQNKELKDIIRRGAVKKK